MLYATLLVGFLAVASVAAGGKRIESLSMASKEQIADSLGNKILFAKLRNAMNAKKSGKESVHTEGENAQSSGETPVTDKKYLHISVFDKESCDKIVEVSTYRLNVCQSTENLPEDVTNSQGQGSFKYVAETVDHGYGTFVHLHLVTYASSDCTGGSDDDYYLSVGFPTTCGDWTDDVDTLDDAYYYLPVSTHAKSYHATLTNSLNDGMGHRRGTVVKIYTDSTECDDMNDKEVLFQRFFRDDKCINYANRQKGLYSVRFECDNADGESFVTVYDKSGCRGKHETEVDYDLSNCEGNNKWTIYCNQNGQDAVREREGVVTPAAAANLRRGAK